MLLLQEQDAFSLQSLVSQQKQIKEVYHKRHHMLLGVQSFLMHQHNTPSATMQCYHCLLSQNKNPYRYVNLYNEKSFNNPLCFQNFILTSRVFEIILALRLSIFFLESRTSAQNGSWKASNLSSFILFLFAHLLYG